MADKYYYIKRGSDIVGPFGTAQIINMIQEQILDKNTMISENRIYWNTAEEILFPKKEVPKTTIFSVPKPKKEKTVEKEKVVLKDEEEVPFILPEEKTKISAPKNIPDPVSATFKMIWHAPQYLKNMEKLHKFQQAASFSNRTVLLCIITEAVMAITLFALLLREYFIAILIASVLVMLCQFLLIFLENLCMSAIARRDKLFENSVLLMQFQLISFTTFMTAVPFAAIAADTNNTLHIALKIGIIIFGTLSAICGMCNMSCGLYRATTDIFKFQMTSKISLIMLNTVQWLVFTTAIFKITEIFKNIL